MKTLKIMRNTLVATISALLIICMYTACPNYVALGAAIDILPPKGEITYPDAGETPIRGSFVMKGTAKDDAGVRAISVRFKNKETGKDTGRAYSAESFPETADTIYWTINVNNEQKGTEDGHPLVKLYPIPDGEYEAAVTITDKNGKKTVLNKTYKIDNTPPVFIVSRPSTFVTNDATPASSSGDGYGAVFSVVGQVGEKNTVEKLEVSVLDKNGSNKKIDLTGMFVGKNINAQIAKSEDTETGAIYKSENNTNPLMPFKAHMYLYDNAREFKGGERGTVGNKAEWYYLSDAIYVDVLSKRYTAEVISDYIAGKDCSGSDDHNKSIRTLREDTDALKALKDAMTKMNECYTTFRLDPRKSPGFRVVNINNLPKAGLNPDNASSILFKDDVTTTVVVELMRNKDGTPLVKSTNLADVKASNIEIILLKWNNTGTEVESFKKGSELDDNNTAAVDYAGLANLIPTSLIKFADFTSQPQVDAVLSVQGGTLRVKCTLPSGFAEGKYLVKVKGTDIDKPTGNTFTAYDDAGAINDGVYIINFLKNVSGPRIRPHRIDGYHNAPFEVKADITGLDGTSTVYYNIDAPAVVNPAKKLIPDSGDLYKATVPVAGLSDGDHDIHFLARKGSGGQDTISTIFKVDLTGPEAKLNYPDPNDPQVGEIEIGGTITDSYAGVDKNKTKWMIVQKPTVPTATTSGWKDMTQSTTGSWKFTANLDTIIGSTPENYGTLESSGYYKIPIYILTEDKNGNKAVRSGTEDKPLHILFDKDGKKPVVKIVSPKNNIKTGGTIQLFGTASAPRGGPGVVSRVYIQFSKSGNFTGGEDGKFGISGTPPGYNNDWQTGNGESINYSTSGGWSLEINSAGQFNPVGTNSHDVYYRLRGEHTDGTLGNWSETRKITIDKDTPVIRNVEIVKGSATERYETNMWIGNGNQLKAQLADGSGLKKTEIRSEYLNYLKSGLPANTWTAIPVEWLSAFSAGGENGYNLTLPINNLQSIPAGANGKLKIEIRIYENTDQNLHTSNEFEFSFDTVNPSGSFGEYMLINTANFGTDSINDGSIVSAVNDYTAGGGNITDLGMLIKNTPVKITGVSGSTVNFSPALANAGSYNYILYKKKTLIHNTGTAGTSPWVIHGVANDDGSGVKEVRAKVKVGTSSSSEVIISGTKISRQLGNQVTWVGNIDLSSLPDGSGLLHYRIIDASGNTYNVGAEYGGTNAVPVTVKNKPIKVSKVTLKTKIGGFEKEFANSAANAALTETTDTAAAAKRDSTLDFVSSNFTFKDKDYSKIKVDFTGGQGQVKYKLFYNNSVLTGHNLKPVPTGGEISLTETDLTAIGNSNGTPKELRLELWDAAEGLNPGTTSAFAKITIKTLFEAIDAKPPVPVISPFRWTDENDNSLYQNSRENGHIEIKADLTARFTEGNSDKLMDRDDKVSGKISIRGTAEDDQVIKEILGQITGFTFSGVSGAANGAETKLTEYDFSTKKFKDIGTGTAVYDPNYMPPVPKPNLSASASEQAAYNAYIAYLTKRETFFNANGWLFTITSSEFDVQTGHAVNWQLDWDSSKIAGGVGTDKKITIKVKDQSTATSHTVSKTLQVDVVPYITEIETFVSGNAGKEFARSAKGFYPVSTGEVIKLYGFNLTQKPEVTMGTDNLTVGNLVSEYYPVTVGASEKSGALDITVGSVKAINNINADPVFDTAGNPTSVPYNVQAHTANKYLNDDVKLAIWKFEDFGISKDIASPIMKMDKNGNWYMSYGKGVPQMIVNKNGTETQVDHSYNKFHNTTVAFDESGNTYALATNTDRVGNNSAKFSFYSRNTSPLTAARPNWKNKDYEISWKGKARLEQVYNQSIYNINRVKRPKMTVTGSSANAKVYMAYFDSNHPDNPVKFRCGIVNNTNIITGGIVDGGEEIDGNYATHEDAMKNRPNASALGYHTIADKTSTYKGGEYTAVGVTSTGTAVVAWYDASKKQLIYSWNGTPQTPESTAAGNTWQTNAKVIDSGYAGWYVDLAVDENDGIHIAYYNSAKGDLKYAYLASCNASPTVVTVDSYLSVGTQIMITTRKEDGNNVPYISYYHPSFTQTPSSVRVAWRTNFTELKDGAKDDSFTGEWEAMTVPTTDIPKDETICHGVPTAPTWKDKLMLGFMTYDGYKKAILKK